MIKTVTRYLYKINSKRKNYQQIIIIINRNYCKN
jgi:hypothetical protein